MQSTPIGTEFTGTKRFLVRRRLGVGGFGVVYQVYDQERLSEVALKLLNKTEASSIYRFKQEFRSLADITHPNLVTLYELLSEKDLWFFTMELVPGVSFSEYVRGLNANSDNPRTEKIGTNTFSNKSDNRQTLEKEDNSPPKFITKPTSLSNELLNIERLRSALKQLVSGVYALHNNEKLHCDLKPSNVLITNEERLVILDFGLVTQVSESKNQQEFFGTPDYMSPEQCLGKNLSESSDWYSVGVMLFEALTGELPFDSIFGNVLREKLRYDPTIPNRLTKDLPQDLVDLCHQLLKRNIQDRPNSREILLSLGIKPKTQGHNVITLGSSPTALVGRDSHLKQLYEAFQIAKTGKTVICYVLGHSGMGKTALVRHFLTNIKHKEKNLIILSGRCYEQESVPYKAFDSVVDNLSQYLKALPSKEIQSLLPEDILLIARLFPVLMQVTAIASIERPVLDFPDFQELRRRAFIALRELLNQLARQKPLVLFIDDLQWGDLDSIALLAELISPPNPLAITLLITYRSEEEESSLILKKLFSLQHSDNVDLKKIYVEQLSSEEATELISTLSETQQNISSEQMEKMVRESGGNPFFIDELIRYSQIDSSNITDISTDLTLEEVILTRVAQLPMSAQRLLQILALAGQPLIRSIAKQAASLENDEQTALAFLRSNHMIRRREREQVEFLEIYHDRVRETLLKNFTSAQRKELHNSLAIALEQSGQADPESLAMHFSGAGEKEKVAEYALKGADQAAQALAFDHAIELYKQVLGLFTSQQQAYQIASVEIKLGNALVNAGRSTEAAKAFLAAAEYSSKEDALELKRRAAEQFLFGGLIDEGLSVLSKVLSSVNLKLASSPLRALIPLLLKRLQIRLRGLEFTPRKESEIPRLELLKIDTCWSAAIGLAVVDTIRGANFQCKHMLLALSTGEPYRVARAIILEAGFSSIGGTKTRKRTEMLLEKAKKIILSINNPHTNGMFYLMSGIAYFLSGKWLRAYQNLEQAVVVLSQQCKGVPWELDSSHFFSSRALLYLGELNRLCERLPGLIKQAEERGDIYAITGLGTALSYVPPLIADNPTEARNQIKIAISKWTATGFHLQHYWALLGQAQVEIYDNKAEDALNLINSQWSPMKKGLLLEVQNSVVEMLHLRARSALACIKNSKEPKNLLKMAEQDAWKLLKEKVTSGNAFSYLLLAAIAFNRNQKDKAIDFLKLAKKNFQDIDMALYQAATNYRLGQLINGDEGKELIRLAEYWMSSQKIKNIPQITEMLAPGFYPR
ncbi:MAG: protein kinase [Acidobacteria bacterium]|nr:protein kinase [Acidobacteriota bacterium]